MCKKIIGFALTAVLLALSFPAQAQQPKKVPRIGFLSGSPPSSIKATPKHSGRVYAIWIRGG